MVQFDPERNAKYLRDWPEWHLRRKPVRLERALHTGGYEVAFTRYHDQIYTVDLYAASETEPLYEAAIYRFVGGEGWRDWDRVCSERFATYAEARAKIDDYMAGLAAILMEKLL